MNRTLTADELRFCSENHLAQEPFRGDCFHLKAGARTDPVWIEGRFDGRPVLSQIQAVMITDRARFANAMIKLGNAFGFARAWGIPTLFHSGFEFFSDDVLADGIRIVKGHPLAENCLKAGFFYKNSLGGLMAEIPSRMECLQRLAPHFSLRFAGPSESPSGDLHIHIRSGDVFSDKTPHRMYGQPPLVFYKMVVRSRPWRRVCIVCEDRLNPVIDALIAFLKQQAIPCRIQSGTLKEDLEVLCEAENIVTARGSFIYPTLCLSRRIRKVFTFEAGGYRKWGLDKSPIEFVHVADRTGIYRTNILRNWKNTESQRRLMLEYEEANLSWG